MRPVDKGVLHRLTAEARIGRLATLDPDGRPNIVPFVFVLDGDTLYSAVDEKPKGVRGLRRIGNIRRDPRVAVLIDHYEEDWLSLWWVRLRGRGRVIDDGPEHQRAVRLLREKYGQYADMPLQGPVIAIDVDEWRGWSWRSIQ